ncbi:dTDP-4-dehydrorhamnose reductase [Bizionia argentinensis JUB59]|uniref:dTDP-4-dehydrorhamnose reductase n=1 Tax=Bizionia argentinensis JUB59 TaxID=1046627 RepID=G2EER5_9FLAO|nr:dTDP-4-dehydrorhamnose reductase [Bizionia argentinensis]EGV43041.1 dTDP-4-dehydrorhamnose reductase [Bizionia argentinensis JUB59]
MIKILVTGGNGQLASCIKDLEKLYNKLKFIYTDYQELDITDLESVDTFFKNNSFDYCINCAAYTAVDKAESEIKIAFDVNEIGAKNLAIVCKDFHATLMHVSTDFVFDGRKSSFYKEEDFVNPISVYGQSKLKGELQISKSLSNHFIFRTSWLYSEHGNNFMKTMMRLSKEKDELSVVVDQIGTPTYAKDLAQLILQLISTKNTQYGLYHYSNEGVASWYDFAKAIFEEIDAEIKLSPIKTTEYPTPAKRPAFSVLDKSKIKRTFQLEIPHWRDSLRKALLNYNG